MKQQPFILLLLISIYWFSCSESPKNQTNKALPTLREVAQVKQENKEVDVVPSIVQTPTTKQTKVANPVKTIADLSPIDTNYSVENSSAYLGIEDVYQPLLKKSVSRRISNKSEKRITFPEGTELQIPENAFVLESGDAVNGPVDIIVKEFYTKEDLLLENLHTMSNGQLLESGGTIHLEVLANGEPCRLRSGKQIEITFPAKMRKKGMEIFYGENNGAALNWVREKQPVTVEVYQHNQTVSPQAIQTSTSIRMAKSSKYKFWTLPSYPGGRKALNKFLRKNSTLPKRILEKGKIERIYVKFKVEKNGEIKNAKGYRNRNKKLEKECVRLVNMMPNFEFNFGQNGPRAEKSNGKIAIQISHTGKLVCINLDMQETSGKKVPQDLAKHYSQMIDSAKFTKKISTNDVFNYTLYTSRLGWINCDRFYRDKREKINLAVAKEPKEDVVIKLIFENMRSIMAGTNSLRQYTFKNIPVKEKVTVFAIKKVKDKIYLATKKITTADRTPIELDYKVVAQNELKQEIEKLNLSS